MTDRNYIVYRYVSPSGKSYIGITKNEELRKSQHISQAKIGPIFAWQKAINKYGLENMKYEVLYSGLDKKVAMILEERSIIKYDSLNNGYNSTPGGECAPDNGIKYLMCDSDMNVIKEFDTQKEASDYSGITQSQISRLSLGLNEKDKNGYMWFKIDTKNVGNDNCDIDESYAVFKSFYKLMFLTIRRMCAYYVLSNEEIEQECAIVFFERPEIAELYIKGDNKRAFSIFSLGLRNSLTDFSATGKQLRGRETKDRQAYLVNRMENIYEEEYTLEEDIMNRFEIERIRKEYGDDYINDIIEYYEIGSDRYCKKYGITNTNARTRIYRKIQKIRNAES